MKQFLRVLQFELSNYFKTKGYVLTTVIISALLIVGLSLPSFFDMSKILPFLGDTKQEEANEPLDEEEISNFAILDKNKLIDLNYLKEFFPSSKFTTVDSENELKKLVEDDEVEGGFVVNSLTDFDYLIQNSTLRDSSKRVFSEMLSLLNRIEYANNNNLNFEELESAYNAPINYEVTILGKDAVNNYSYAYLLLLLLYFMIITYGQLIATSVTNEKSNRSIEILVTSVNTTSLICGKVIAAALAGFIQLSTMIGSGILAYNLNKDTWNSMLDNIFYIPYDILLIFILFGGVGYLFYAFIFGALGALVSKTEDISSSITSISMIFMLVFFIAMFNMHNSDSILMKVSSFIPFSSIMTMPTRFAMGSVSMLEISISFVILTVSTMFVAYIAAKIYRMATLRYGNPIKLKDALKLVRKNN
ncbi:ABC transporter permease [Paraclostridium sordellii]|uniref:Sodium ABC transporter permease n=1 Tax=Paraclostridium sordellii TaxID=1505 RepID=A0A9P1KYL7_PARSO|nr:ABC transporter permease [Paeniclostridium sordellii]CEN31331.1 sodium ABC transporter permease [[Clostridium] sordellii] [Paeniclostridium sordellii]